MEQISRLAVPVGEHDHAIGPAGAPAVLVEYGDYECPYCGAAQAVVTSLRHRLGERLCLVVRHFPVTHAHPDALGAALAAEAAGRQGKFWEMHEALYLHQEDLGQKELLAYADELRLDLERFRRDLEDPALLHRIEADREGGKRSGVRGTPAFFVNGALFEGDWRGTELLHAIEQVIGHGGHGS